MADTVPLEEFGVYFTDLMEKEAKNAEDALEEVIEKRAKQLRDKLRQRSPKKTGVYAKGWAVKTVTRNHERIKVLYNKNKPGLTYILEYGTRHQKAQPHIRPGLLEAMDEIIDELVDQL